MKPGQRIVHLVAELTVAIAALSACRKEVPPPTPTPTPDQSPKPRVQATAYAAWEACLGGPA